MSKTNKILIALAIWFTLFCIAVFVVMWHTGNEPVVLCGAVAVTLVYELRALLRLKLDKRARAEVKECVNNAENNKTS